MYCKSLCTDKMLCTANRKAHFIHSIAQNALYIRNALIQNALMPSYGMPSTKPWLILQWWIDTGEVAIEYIMALTMRRWAGIQSCHSLASQPQHHQWTAGPWSWCYHQTAAHGQQQGSKSHHHHHLLHECHQPHLRHHPRAGQGQIWGHFEGGRGTTCMTKTKRREDQIYNTAP
jgi:hypothetical protein